MSTSSVNQVLQDTKYSNSILNQEVNTVTVKQVITNLADVIPQDDYMPFYISSYRKLGYKRFVELANKARRGKNPARLFFWMLKNNELVN